MDFRDFVENRFGAEGLMEEAVEVSDSSRPDDSQEGGPDSGLGWRESLLAKAGIPQKDWEFCYLTETGEIFTPVYDQEGDLLETGKAAYQKWLEGTTGEGSESIPSLAEKNRADIDYLLMMGGYEF